VWTYVDTLGSVCKFNNFEFSGLTVSPLKIVSVYVVLFTGSPLLIKFIILDQDILVFHSTAFFVAIGGNLRHRLHLTR